MAAPAATPTPTAQPDILKLPEVAKYLRISVSQAYALAKEKALPVFYVGTSPRCRRRDIERMIESQLQ
jgi:excisionase family DNA binding protein